MDNERLVYMGHNYPKFDTVFSQTSSIHDIHLLYMVHNYSKFDTACSQTSSIHDIHPQPQSWDQNKCFIRNSFTVNLTLDDKHIKYNCFNVNININIKFYYIKWIYKKLVVCLINIKQYQ